MRRLILIGLFAGLLAPAGLHAQKVCKEGNKVILDMSVDARMPEGAVTTSRKDFVDKQPQKDKYLDGSTTNNSVSTDNNATVYHKLEIAKSNYTSGADWVSAFSGCKGWTHNGSSGWRLPTQRELQMMYIFKPALEALGVTPFDAAICWSATEDSATNSWYVSFSSGVTYNASKTVTTFRVRCVREIVD